MDGKLHQDVGEIKGKVDLIIGLLERGAARMDDHGKRIGALETNSNWRARVAVLVGTAFGAGGGHFFRVIIAAVALSALLTRPAPGAAPKAVIDARRAAIVTTVRSIGVYPGAEITVGGNTYLIESVEVSADYVVTIRNKLLRSTD